MNSYPNFLKQWWKFFPKYPRLVWGLSILWLLLIVTIAFVYNLGNTGLIDETEPVFAESARQMTVTGDWITPYFNGKTRFDKPPLIYWLMAIFYKVIGVNEWAVRLPSAIAAIALTFVCFYTLRYFGFSNFNSQKNQVTNQRQLWIAAWIGGSIVALNPYALIWSHQGVSDMLLTGCVGIALLCFFWGYVTSEKQNLPPQSFLKSLLIFPNSWYLAFYIFTALAVLTKGPIGIVLPGLIILPFLWYLGKLKTVFQEMGIVWGTLIFSLISVPWYILVTIENGQDYLNSFFGYHNFERFTGVVNQHEAPWYFYFLIILILFIPWSVFLPVSMARVMVWRRKFWQKQPRKFQLNLFAIFWFLSIFIFFSIAITKLPSYTLPVIPAGAILIASLWSEEFTDNNKNYSKNWDLLISCIVNIILLIILAIGFILLPNIIGNDPAAVDLPGLIRESGLPIRGAIVWGITALISIFLLIKRNRWQWLIAINILGFIAFIIFLVTPTLFLVDKARQLPLREISYQLEEVAKPQEEFFMIGFKKPSVVFYTQRFTIFFNSSLKLAPYLNKTANIPDSPSTILIVSRPQDLNRLRLQSDDYQLLVDKPPYQLIRIEKEIIFKNDPNKNLP